MPVLMMEHTYKDGAFPKTCSCGEVYTEALWGILTFAYVQTSVCEDTGRRYYDDLEARHCICGSTIAVPLKSDDGGAA